MLSVALSGCVTKNVIYQSTYSRNNETSEDSSLISSYKEFIEDFYNQLLSTPTYSAEKTREFLQSAINKDLWYYGEHSKFHKLIGYELPYYCNRSSTGTIGYLIFVEPAHDPSKINNYTENFYYVSVDLALNGTETAITECIEMIIKDKDEFISFTKSYGKTIPMDRDYIKIGAPTKPKYKSSKLKEQELAEIKSHLEKALQKADIKGKNKIYIRDFFDEFYNAEKPASVKTDIFIVDKDNNIYQSSYLKDLSQNSGNSSPISGEMQKIDPGDKKAMYYFGKVKETAAQTYTLDIK